MLRLHVVLALLSLLHCKAEQFHFPKIKFTRRGAGKAPASNTTQAVSTAGAGSKAFPLSIKAPLVGGVAAGTCGVAACAWVVSRWAKPLAAQWHRKWQSSKETAASAPPAATLSPSPSRAPDEGSADESVVAAAKEKSATRTPSPLSSEEVAATIPGREPSTSEEASSEAPPPAASEETPPPPLSPSASTSEATAAEATSTLEVETPPEPALEKEVAAEASFASPVPPELKEAEQEVASSEEASGSNVPTGSTPLSQPSSSSSSSSSSEALPPPSPSPPIVEAAAQSAAEEPKRPEAPPQSPPAPLATPPAASPPPSTSTTTAETTPSGGRKEWAEALLGPTLLQRSANGTRLEGVATSEALQGGGGGGVKPPPHVVLYLSSAAHEKELQRLNMTQAMLSSYLERVRQQVCSNTTNAAATTSPSSSSSSPPLLVMVYVSLDDAPLEFRAMLRRLGPPPPITPTVPTAAPAEDATPDTAQKEEAAATEEKENKDKTSCSSANAVTWLAVPHCDVNLREQLVNQFVTSDVPTAIVFSPDGEVLNRAALGLMLTEPENFPWKAKSPLELLFGTSSSSNEEDDDGDDVSATVLLPHQQEEGGEESPASSSSPPQQLQLSNLKAVTKGKRYLGLYFSASWCAPCKAFTPVLAAAYPQLQQPPSSSCEFLFVSHDNNASSFDEYRNTMPWPSLPFDLNGGSRRLRADLATSLGIQSLPSLVILDTETGEVVCEDGRTALLRDPSCAGFPWSKNKEGLSPEDSAEMEEATIVSDLGIEGASLSGLMDKKAILLFTDLSSSSSDDPGGATATTAASRLSASLKRVATAWRLAHVNNNNNNDNDVDDVAYFACSQPSEVVSAVRELCNMETAQDDINKNNEDANERDEANSSGDLLFGDLTNGKEATKAKDETSPVAPPSLVLLNFPRREFVHLPLPTSFEDLSDEALDEQMGLALKDAIDGKFEAIAIEGDF